MVFAAIAAAAIAASEMLVRSWLSHLSGAVRWVAFGLVLTAAFVIVLLVPGVLGVLSRWTMLGSAVVLFAAVTLLSEWVGRPPGSPAAHSQPDTDRLAVAAKAIAAVTVALVAVYLLAYLRAALPVPTEGTDALAFHIPGVASWMQSGSLWEIHQFVPNQPHGYYPNNGDLFLLAAALPWGDDAFVRLVGLPFLGLTGLSIYACAVELRATRPLAAGFAAAFVAMPMVVFPPLQDAMPDTVLLATLAAGLLFLLRHARTGQRSDLLLAGLGLGLAFGAKWYGVSSVVAILAVWAAARVAAGRGVAPTLRALGMLGGMIALAGGFWLLRNAVASGNPAFPVHLSAFGVTLLDAPPDRVRELTGFSIAHYLGDPQAWSDYLLPALWRTLRAPGVLIGAGALAGLCAGALSRRRSAAGPWGSIDPRVLVMCAGAIVLAGVYVLTPFSALGPDGMPVQADANTRYLAPALLVAAPALAAVAATGVRIAFAMQLAALVAAADAVAHGLNVGTAAVLETMAVLAAAALVAVAMRSRRSARGLTPALVAGAAALTAAAVLAGYKAQRDVNSNPYLGHDNAIDTLVARAPEGSRIALTGSWDNKVPVPVLPAFGPLLDNEVEYAGPTVDGFLRRYRSCAPLLERLRQDRFDLLLVGRGFRHTNPLEARCARAAGFRTAASSNRFYLFAPVR